VTLFERRYLRRVNTIGLWFFWAHVPVIMLLAWANDMSAWVGGGLALATVSGPALAHRMLDDQRSVSITYGVAAMMMGGVLVHIGQGIVQIEMHFYFFVLLGLLAVFGNPMVVVAAAATVVAHHLALWLLLPSSVFNYDAPLWVVAVHGLFVLAQSVGTCFVARAFFDNVIGLDWIVRSRTTELDARSDEMRLVLDNVVQGIATIDRDGVASAVHSRMLDVWFGADRGTETQTLFDLFARLNPAFGEASRFAWDEVTEGVMPLELTLEQMPKQLERGPQCFRVVYQAIGEGDAPERFLVVVTDVTAEVQRRRAERDQKETACIFGMFLRDRPIVYDFFDEASAFVEYLASGEVGDPQTFSRLVHTLKGNASIFGLESVVMECQAIEAHLSAGGEIRPEILDPLLERWSVLACDVGALIGARRPLVEIEQADHAAIERAVRDGEAYSVLLRRIHAARLDPTRRRLEHFAGEVQRIARRGSKSVEFIVEGNGLRVDPHYWQAFWAAFVHVVRNAMDHGLETVAERLALGKPARGTLSLRTYLRNESFVVEVSDDGRGVDWESIAAKARALGLPAASRAELEAALFHDGVTTAPELSDISGRGVGLAALVAATDALGGVVEVESSAGAGTSIRMVFPSASVSPDLGPADALRLCQELSGCARDTADTAADAIGERARHFGVLDHYLVTGARSLFAAHGLEMEYAAVESMPRPGDVMMAAIEYDGEDVRGSLLLRTSREMVEALRPARVGPSDTAPDDLLGDVLGEFANMLLGRVKNQLANHGVSPSLGIPRCEIGTERDVPAPRSGVSAWHTFRVGPHRFFARFDATFGPGFSLKRRRCGAPALGEGEMVLFDVSEGEA
jgi:two-component system chemotaxis sensor kinase CheA